MEIGNHTLSLVKQSPLSKLQERSICKNRRGKSSWGYFRVNGGGRTIEKQVRQLDHPYFETSKVIQSRIIFLPIYFSTNDLYQNTIINKHKMI